MRLSSIYYASFDYLCFFVCMLLLCSTRQDDCFYALFSFLSKLWWANFCMFLVGGFCFLTASLWPLLYASC